MPERLSAVIVAAGSGTRMDGIDKLFTPIAGKAILARAIAAFEESPLVDRIVVVVSQENVERARELVRDEGFTKASVCVGGARRQDSVRCGLEALGECEYVAIHDGARPLVSGALIERGLEAARRTGAAVPGLPVAETVKETTSDGTIVRTVDRSRLYTLQTPQVFRYEVIARAHQEVTLDHSGSLRTGYTDDAAMVEALGEPVVVFAGERTNVKITTPEDLDLVEALLAGRGVRPRA
jgi:2-C-methyl-D-erythritol 4-phosphate cytidylyltransferase